MAQDLHPAVNAIIGAMAGVGEACIMQPTVFWKTELQQNRFSVHRAINPRFAYRGVGVQAASCAPIQAVQFAANGMVLDLARRLRAGADSPPTDIERVLAGLFAGAISALVMTPTDAVMITQQRHGGAMVGTFRQIYSRLGLAGFYRSLDLCALRKSTGTCCYIALYPLVKRELTERHPDMVMVPSVAAVGSSTLSCLLNHPADTLKTRIQGSLFPQGKLQSQPTTMAALRALHTECGGDVISVVRSLYRGLLPRLFRISCGCIILDSIKSTLEQLAKR